MSSVTYETDQNASLSGLLKEKTKAEAEVRELNSNFRKEKAKLVESSDVAKSSLNQKHLHAKGKLLHTKMQEDDTKTAEIAKCQQEIGDIENALRGLAKFPEQLAALEKMKSAEEAKISEIQATDSGIEEKIQECHVLYQEKLCALDTGVKEEISELQDIYKALYADALSRLVDINVLIITFERNQEQSRLRNTGELKLKEADRKKREAIEEADRKKREADEEAYRKRREATEEADRKKREADEEVQNAENEKNRIIRTEEDRLAKEAVETTKLHAAAIKMVEKEVHEKFPRDLSI